MHPLEALAKEFREKYFHCSMEIGKTTKHPDGRTIKIVDGRFLDPVYGRVSNWWTWREILPNGKFGKKESGYGW